MSLMPYYPNYCGFYQQPTVYTYDFNSYNCGAPQLINPTNFYPQFPYVAHPGMQQTSAAQWYANYMVGNNDAVQTVDEEIVEIKEVVNNYSNTVSSVKKPSSSQIRFANAVKEELMEEVRNTITNTVDNKNQKWWKINFNKDKQEKKLSKENMDKTSVVPYKIADSRSSKCPDSEEIIVIKPEDDNVASAPISEVVLNLMNQKSKPKIKNCRGSRESTNLKKNSKRSVNRSQPQEIRSSNTEIKENYSNSLTIVREKCKKILSKFAINETSNDYLSDIEWEQEVEKDVGQNLNTTMRLIMMEMQSIDVSSNFLSLKLSPRQKQNISLLIIDEINELNLPKPLWLPMCRLVVKVLNEYFKKFFQNTSSLNKANEQHLNNSWLWIVELANSYCTE